MWTLESSQRFPQAGVNLLPGVVKGVSDDEFRQFVQDFYALSAGMHEIRGHLANVAGLSHSSYIALMAIAHLQNPEGVTVNDVAKYLKLKGSSVTIEMSRLVEMGLVTKNSDPNDKRKVLLLLSPKAQQLMENVSPIWSQVNGAVFAVLSPEEFAHFREVVRNVLSNVNSALNLARFLSEQSNPQ